MNGYRISIDMNAILAELKMKNFYCIFYTTKYAVNSFAILKYCIFLYFCRQKNKNKLFARRALKSIKNNVTINK